MLLEPQLEQARGVVGFEIGDRHQRADIGGRDRIAVNLETVGVEAETLPEAELVHVGFDVELEHSVILDPLIEAAPIAEALAVIDPADFDPVAPKCAARARRVERHDGVFRYARCAMGDFGLGKFTLGSRGGWQGPERQREHARRACRSQPLGPHGEAPRGAATVRRK